jgi:hypothetical protein
MKHTKEKRDLAQWIAMNAMIRRTGMVSDQKRNTPNATPAIGGIVPFRRITKTPLYIQIDSPKHAKSVIRLSVERPIT